MKMFVTWLICVVWLLPATAGADQRPARGKLLVATELVQGELFAKTVILILHYDETGATGLVVNRPTEIEPKELLPDVHGIFDYSGTLFWGGPVRMTSVRALLRTDTPPENAEAVVDSVYRVPFDDSLMDAPTDPATLRLFMGYAGWGAGQLDSEMATGSWHVVPASGRTVFAEDPSTLWERLRPPLQAYLQPLPDITGSRADD